MASNATLIVSQVLLVAGGIGVYHVALAPRAPRGATSIDVDLDSSSSAAIAALRRDFEALERRVGGSSPASPGASAYAESLRARLEALEQRLIPASADAGGLGPAGLDRRAGTWTEDQISSLRSMMDEVESRRATDRETASYRDLVRRVAPNLGAPDESAAVSLLTQFMRTIRALFAGASAGNTPEERAATNAKAAAEREKLLSDLSTVLSKDVVERLSAHIPDFGGNPAHIPPNKTAPGEAAMDPVK